MDIKEVVQGKRFDGGKLCRTQDLVKGAFVTEFTIARVEDSGPEYTRVRKLDLVLGKTVDFNIHTDLATEVYQSTATIAEVKVTRTQLIEAFMVCNFGIVEVVFHKQVKEEHVAKRLREMKSEEVSSAQKSKKVAKELLEGEVRKLVGLVYRHDEKWGRTQMFDAEELFKNGSLAGSERLVDHRTIVSVKYGNVMYKLK